MAVDYKSMAAERDTVSPCWTEIMFAFLIFMKTSFYEERLSYC